MDAPEKKYYQILKLLSKSEKKVGLGKMMSAPGIVYENRVFAFYWREQMGLRAGREFDPSTLKIKKWENLNPYKNKPPMVDWFILPFEESAHWGKLAKVALKRMMLEDRTKKKRSQKRS